MLQLLFYFNHDFYYSKHKNQELGKLPLKLLRICSFHRTKLVEIVFYHIFFPLVASQRYSHLFVCGGGWGGGE